jgi:predicted NUDIX family NTP pyrophosphohydrolase
MNRRFKRGTAAFGVRGCAIFLVLFAGAMTRGVVSPFATSAPPTFASPKAYATGGFPLELEVADVNGDGRLDLATANYREGVNSVSVLVNGGGGRFRARRDYGVGEAPGSLEIADLNGDRKPDLAVANETADSVSVLLNTGDGTFARRRDYPTGHNPVSVAIGDVNGDGTRDLAIANFVVNDPQRVGVPGTVSVLLSSGDGGFQPKIDYTTGQRPHQVVIGDLTGDGRPDLATGNRSDSVSVLTNKGNGTFGSPLNYRAGSGPRAIATADLNGDGRLDLVTANTNFEVYTVSVLINRGDGMFRSKRDYRGGNGPFSIAIGDVNGDGSRDLAAAVVSGNGVSVLLNKGNGTFLPRRDYRTGREPWSVAIADLTGDGKHDLATANSVANSVSVLANTTGLCTVPNVTGMTVPAAKQALVRGNCRIGAIRRAYSKRVARGRVISETPKVGTVLPKSGKVGIVVSRGARQ